MVNFISLFSGCGGSSLGYHKAGFTELLAIDWDDNAIETFKANFPEVPIRKWDLNKITAQEILTEINLKKGELDLLDASPPCQGFSMAGKRNIFDERNDLYLKTLTLIEEIAPKVFVIENVKGMIIGGHKHYTKLIMKKLNTLDYNWKMKLMNAKYYGVPQSRARIIVIGIRKDLNKIPTYPIPLNKLIPVREALNSVKVGKYKILKGKRAEFLNKLRPGERISKYTPGKYFGTCRLNPNRPVPTITKTLYHTDTFGDFFIRWDSDRGLSIEELKRLCSFPDNFILLGTFEEQVSRLGNAVMPEFMFAIAKHIKENVFKNKL